MGDDSVAYSSADTTAIAEQISITKAYLDTTKSIVAGLARPLTLPVQTQDITVVDQTIGQHYAVSTIDVGYTYYAILVGDLQTYLGALGNWYTDDKATFMTRVHGNLYQFRGRLPAGKYHYKVAFNGAFDGAFPAENILLQVPTDNTAVTFSFVPFDSASKGPRVYDSLNDPEAPLPASSAGITTDALAITLADELDITHILQLVQKDGQRLSIVPRNVLNEQHYLYNGDDLGSRYMRDATTFRVWAPTASKVQLFLYDTESGPLKIVIAMIKSEGGTWYAQVGQDLANWYYLYEVTIADEARTAVDPYVRALAVNAHRGMIVNLDETNPSEWQNDTYVALANAVDASIYEIHVRDFSINEYSGMTNRGQFLAFTEQNTTGPDGVTTGLAHLRELGITHVQVLPISEFASVDETTPEQYNWGYDPRNYNVPEGAYASTPHGPTRITEYKKMIQSLHATGIGVIMDVVYNHTYETINSDFDKIVPDYFYRTDFNGNYTNGSGCGNEVATERPMVQKFVRDSVKYWAQQYHVDGFRFDLMAPLGVALMSKTAEDLRAINPHVLLYGEPWTGGTSGLRSGQLLVKGRQKGLGIGVFNDDIRNALNGGAFDAHMRGFVTGEPGQVGTIKHAVIGSIDSFTSAPGETINYVTSHDNYTLWDKIAVNSSGESEADRIKMDELAQAIVFTAQGIPFMQGGEEFLRTKGGNENSYNAGDAVNQFDWTRKAQYKDVVAYYRGLIHLRRNHPAFRLPTAAAIQQHLVFLDSPDNTVAFTLHDSANGDSWKHIIVIYNPNKAEVAVNLPAGEWVIVATQGHVGEEEIGRATETVTIPPITCMIMHSA